jgi:hypothetical protein
MTVQAFDLVDARVIEVAEIFDGLPGTSVARGKAHGKRQGNGNQRKTCSHKTRCCRPAKKGARTGS